MVEAFGDLWYEDVRVPGGKAWNLFEFPVINHKRRGEDIYFCQRFSSIGGEIWTDPHLTLHHHGDKTYSGRFADYVRQVAALEKAEPTATA
jgi:hypothetical protein